MKQIPNIFTLLNLVFGSVAIIFALQTNAVIIFIDQQYNSSFNIPEKLTWASLCILLAAVIDFLDGFVARLLKATSEMGKQLDSLSDVVSFGVAPSVIIYQLLRLSYAREENGLEMSMLFLVPALLIGCAAAYRLARFNISEDQQYSFKGVPVPAVGILIASFPLIMHFGHYPAVNDLIMNKWFLYVITLLVAYLMVSNLTIMSLKFADFTFRNNYPKIILGVIALVSALFLQWLAIPVVFICYILFSLFTSKNLQSK